MFLGRRDKPGDDDQQLGSAFVRLVHVPQPPLTTEKHWPEIARACSEQRKAMALPMSSGRPGRLSGSRAYCVAISSS